MDHKRRKAPFMRFVVLSIAIICSLAFSIFCVPDVHMHNVLNSTILANAEDHATFWTSDFAVRTPLLINVVDGEVDAMHYMDLTLQSARNSNIFSFKVFAPMVPS